jgi:hypothetical protein
MTQKRSLTLIVFSVVFLLFIAGCDGGPVASGAPTTPFLGGTQGLEIGFLEGSPPDEVTDGNSFDFQALIRIKNIGEFDLKREQVNVSMIGIVPVEFDSSIEGLRNKHPEDDPSPRQRDSEGNIIEAVETFVTFPNETANGYFNFKGSLVGNTDSDFRADVCYKYGTSVVSEICVLESMIDVADDAICDPSEIKSVFSSGSPIGVTSFRQSVVGKHKLQFSFDIVHSGSGNVFVWENEFPECPKTSSGRRSKGDKINVTVKTGLDVVTTNTPPLICVGLTDKTDESLSRGSIKLVGGKRTITCTQTLQDPRTDFKKTVNINLTFDYLESIDKKVLVKHLTD